MIPTEPVGPSRQTVRLRSSRDTSGEVQRVLGKLEALGTDLTIVRLLANSPTSFRPFVLLSDSLLTRSTLPAEVREIVILHIAARRNVSYEWWEHERMSANAGITGAQVSAVRAGDRDSHAFTYGHQLGMSIADELLAGNGLSRERWDEAMACWGLEGAIDLVISIAWWGGLIPLLLEAFGLRADEGDEPFSGT
jgi:4-carboxymuconolactone decarboxylase